jgi:hypothetical protein
VEQSPYVAANISSVSQETCRISRNLKIHYRVHKSPPPLRILSHYKFSSRLQSYFLRIYINIILPCMPRPSMSATRLKIKSLSHIGTPRGITFCSFGLLNKINTNIVQTLFWRYRVFSLHHLSEKINLNCDSPLNLIVYTAVMQCQNAARNNLVENSKYINKCESVTARSTNNLSFCGSALLQQKQNTFGKWILLMKERSPFHFSLYCRMWGTRWRSGWGTALQTGRSRDRFPIVSLDFFTDVILPAALWPGCRLRL